MLSRLPPAKELTDRAPMRGGDGKRLEVRDADPTLICRELPGAALGKSPERNAMIGEGVSQGQKRWRGRLLS